jgi:hypothetical protein
VLKDYKAHEYQERWAYELASLYAEAGQIEDCVRECDELILWFSEGEYVVKAMELKMQFEPLSASQQEKYEHRFRSAEVSSAHEDDFDETEVEFNNDRFSTMNLQAELAANLGELFQEDATIKIPTLEIEEILQKVEEEAGVKTEPEEEPEFGITLEELKLPEEEPEEEAVELEELKLPEEEPEEAAVELEELKLPEEEPEEEAVELEELKLPEEEAVELEELKLPEEEPEEPAVELEELKLPEEEPEEEAVELEELKLPEEEPKEPAVELEELKLPEEEPEEEPAEPEAESEEDPVVEKQITGQMTIYDILSEWENKKAETEAILEAGAEKEHHRKEKVKQETAELMKLINGVSEAIPEDVQQILEEDKKLSPIEALITVDDLPQDLEVPEIPEEEGSDISFENLDEPEIPTIIKKERISQDTTSMNMIQELERSLAAEVSEMAVNSGHLTREQASLFAYFTSVKGMSQQLSVLFKSKPDIARTSSGSGNLVVTGRQGNGKTTLAIDIVKALQKQKRIEGNRLAKISGQKLNSRDIYEVFSKLKSGALIIESAGGLSDETMVALSLAMEGDTGGMLVILEDSAEEIRRIFLKNKNFASKFDYTIDIPIFSNDELVAFGKSYALESEYVFDEFAVLALYDRIGCRQTNDHMVTVAEVKDIVDQAIAHAESGTVRHVFARLTKKNVDEFGNHMLREEDFRES